MRLLFNACIHTRPQAPDYRENLSYCSLLHLQQLEQYLTSVGAWEIFLEWLIKELNPACYIPIMY